MTALLLLIIITMSNGDIKVGKTLPESYESVSYTHLDVYKRQLWWLAIAQSEVVHRE